MSDRLERIERLCESNARAIQANAEQSAATERKIDNLANIVQAFITKLDSEGLKVTLVTDVADDTAAEVNEIERNQNHLNASIESLRADAIADRQAFREQAESDRQAWQRNFDAQLQILQSQLLELGRVNRRLDDLEQAG